MHGFKVPVTYDDHEACLGLELPSMNAFLVTRVDKVVMYDDTTYKAIDEVPIELLKAETREPNQIIAIQKSDDD